MSRIDRILSECYTMWDRKEVLCKEKDGYGVIIEVCSGEDVHEPHGHVSYPGSSYVRFKVKPNKPTTELDIKAEPPSTDNELTQDMRKKLLKWIQDATNGQSNWQLLKDVWNKLNPNNKVS